MQIKPTTDLTKVVVLFIKCLVIVLVLMYTHCFVKNEKPQSPCLISFRCWTRRAEQNYLLCANRFAGMQMVYACIVLSLYKLGEL